MLNLNLFQDQKEVERKILNETTEACRQSRSRQGKRKKRCVTSQSNKMTQNPSSGSRPSSTTTLSKTRTVVSTTTAGKTVRIIPPTPSPAPSLASCVSKPPERAPRRRDRSYSWKHQMAGFIEILNIQTSQSYRPPAVIPSPPPTPEEDNKSESENEDEDIGKLLILFCLKGEGGV